MPDSDHFHRARREPSRHADAQTMRSITDELSFAVDLVHHVICSANQITSIR